MPTPPGPTAVTSRCEPRASAKAARSAARPINDVSGDGHLAVPLAGTAEPPCAVGAGSRLAAMPASARRSRAPSLRSREETWLSTVRIEMKSLAPISAFVRCSATPSSTSASRADTPGGGHACSTCLILPDVAAGTKEGCWPVGINPRISVQPVRRSLHQACSRTSPARPRRTNRATVNTTPQRSPQQSWGCAPEWMICAAVPAQPTQMSAAQNRYAPNVQAASLASVYSPYGHRLGRRGLPSRRSSVLTSAVSTYGFCGRRRSSAASSNTRAVVREVPPPAILRTCQTRPYCPLAAARARCPSAVSAGGVRLSTQSPKRRMAVVM